MSYKIVSRTIVEMLKGHVNHLSRGILDYLDGSPYTIPQYNLNSLYVGSTDINARNQILLCMESFNRTLYNHHVGSTGSTTFTN